MESRRGRTKQLNKSIVNHRSLCARHPKMPNKHIEKEYAKISTVLSGSIDRLYWKHNGDHMPHKACRHTYNDDDPNGCQTGTEIWCMLRTTKHKTGQFPCMHQKMQTCSREDTNMRGSTMVRMLCRTPRSKAQSPTNQWRKSRKDVNRPQDRSGNGPTQQQPDDPGTNPAHQHPGQ